MKKHRKTPSMPLFRHRPALDSYSPERLNNVLIKNPTVFPMIKYRVQSCPLTERLQKSLQQIIDSNMPQNIQPLPKSNHQIIFQGEESAREYDQQVQQLTNIRLLLQSLDKVKKEMQKCNNSLLLKKIKSKIQVLREKQLIGYLWKNGVNTTDSTLKKLLQKHHTLYKDLNLLTNIARNILSQFKVGRWSHAQNNILRKRDSMDKAMIQVSKKIHNCDADTKRNIVQTVRKIKPECLATRLYYLEWSKRATNQLKSRRMLCQLLKDQIFLPK